MTHSETTSDQLPQDTFDEELTLGDLPAASKLMGWVPQDVNDAIEHLDDLIDAMIELFENGLTAEGLQLKNIANLLHESRRDELLKHLNPETQEIQVDRMELNIVYEATEEGRELYRSWIVDQLLMSCECTNTRILNYIASITLAYVLPDEDSHPHGVLGATIEWVRPTVSH